MLLINGKHITHTKASASTAAAADTSSEAVRDASTTTLSVAMWYLRLAVSCSGQRMAGMRGVRP
jgi:hypothetical protein